MATPETRFTTNAVNDLSHPIAGLNGWSPVNNVTIEDDQTADVQLVSTEDFKDTSRILLTQSHHFNLPDGVDSIDNIEMSWKVDEQSDTVRFLMALYVGGYGTVTILNSSGNPGPQFITVSGTPAELGHPGLTITDIKGTFFGAAIVAHDSQKTSPLIRIDSVKIKVSFSGTFLTYNESDDFFFAEGSHVLTNGKAKTTPYFINLPGERDGSGLLGGDHFVGGSQTMVGTGGALVIPNAEINPYFEVGTGGAKLGGIGHQTYIEIPTGGMIAGGLSPNGTHDFGVGGIRVSGLIDLKVDFVTGEGGTTIGGKAKATPYFINLPGETDGGVKLNSRAKTQYTEVAVGGILVSPDHFFSFPPLFAEGGSLAGGEAEVNPYFEVATGGVRHGGIAKVEVIWIGLPPFSLFQGGTLIGGENLTTVNLVEFPDGGSVAGGHSVEVSTIDDIAGGALSGGRTIAAIQPAIDGGILANGDALNNAIKNPLLGGGVVCEGTFTFSFFADGTGGVIIEGEIDHPIFKLFYTPTGDANITVENAESTAIALVHLFYTGDGEVIISGTSLLTASYIYNTIGGVDIAGQSVNRASYIYNTVLGTGLVIGSVSNTGIPHIFRNIRWPNGTIGRSLASDNIFKTEMESLLITTIPPNPVLAGKGLSTTDITLNKCQGAFVPPQLVNRQREHLPSPKQEEKNRSSQLAKNS